MQKKQYFCSAKESDDMTVLYEDNHIIAVNKTCNEIVQGDKTGDTPLSEIVKEYIKDKYNFKRKFDFE